MAAIFVATATSPASAATPVPPAPPAVGIRLVDAPTSLSDDPRAHSYIIDHLAQGATISRGIEITNTTTSTQHVQLYPAAATISGGAFVFGAGQAANDLTSWTTISPATVSPVAGGDALATVTIAVPLGASPGERYGVIWAQLPTAVAAGGGVAAVNRVGIRIYLSVGQGAAPVTDFAITALTAQRDRSGRPTVAVTVRNTGERAVDLSGQLTLANGPGGLSAGPFPATLGTTLGIGQTEPASITLERAVPAGPWDATIMLQSGVTQRQAEATITFPVAVASSAKPALVHGATGSGNGLVLAVVGAAGVIMLLLLVLLFRRRRRQNPGPPPGAALAGATTTGGP